LHNFIAAYFIYEKDYFKILQAAIIDIMNINDCDTLW